MSSKKRKRIAASKEKSSAGKLSFSKVKDSQKDSSRTSSGNWFNCLFHQFAKLASRFTGHPLAFCLAISIVVIWGISGPLFQYSDTWQLVINTGTTIITFLMVFLIQSTQNRDMAATQIKLDELIRALDSARNSMLDLEELEEDDLEKVRSHYEKLAQRSREQQGLSENSCEGPDADMLGDDKSARQ